MAILAIDFGLRHIGLAISANNVLAEPLDQISYKDKKSLFKKLKDLVKSHKVKRIVIGISENQMAKKTRRFGQKLFSITKIPIFYQDETLSSQEVSQKMIQSGAKKKKRQTKTHQAAAAIILQDFLDEDKNFC